MNLITQFIRNYRGKKFYSKLIYKDALCFDIGANLGTKSKLFLASGANVIAFEPQSICLGALSEIKTKNPKFDFYPYAIGGNNTQAELHLANNIEVATLSEDFIDYFKCEQIYWNNKESVTVKSLDYIIQQYGIPDFCKIDVEGFEYEILSNLNYKIPIIEFEFTGGFIENTLKIIDFLNKDNTFFNFILNENLKFCLNKWVNGKEMKTIIKSLNTHKLHGNIFVKS